jgi:hypothetical protein
MKFGIWLFFENVFGKFEFLYNLTRITGALHEDQYTIFIISRSVLLRMKSFSDRSVERVKTHSLRSITFFSKIFLFMR